jgi:hypothetical protein
MRIQVKECILGNHESFMKESAKWSLLASVTHQSCASLQLFRVPKMTKLKNEIFPIGCGFFFKLLDSVLYNTSNNSFKK